jgi:hypothetical protein
MRCGTKRVRQSGESSPPVDMSAWGHDRPIAPMNSAGLVIRSVDQCHNHESAKCPEAILERNPRRLLAFAGFCPKLSQTENAPVIGGGDL